MTNELKSFIEAIDSADDAVKERAADIVSALIRARIYPDERSGAALELLVLLCRLSVEDCCLGLHAFNPSVRRSTPQ